MLCVAIEVVRNYHQRATYCLLNVTEINFHGSDTQLHKFHQSMPLANNAIMNSFLDKKTATQWCLLLLFGTNRYFLYTCRPIKLLTSAFIVSVCSWVAQWFLQRA